MNVRKFCAVYREFYILSNYGIITCILTLFSSTFPMEKLLHLGKAPINLAFLSFFRIFAANFSNHSKAETNYNNSDFNLYRKQKNNSST